MSYHLDKVEFFELINDNDWDALWDAYSYAVYGGEEPPRKVFNGVECQHCGSKRFIKKEADELFIEQVGCLDCDRWLTPVRYKGGE